MQSPQPGSKDRRIPGGLLTSQLSLVDELQAKEILPQAVSDLPEEDSRMRPLTSVFAQALEFTPTCVYLHT